MTTHSLHAQRGSALLTTMVLIGVLLVIGVAAISLSSQERTNAGAKAKLDFARACGNAAQAQIWSELAAHGTSHLGNLTATMSPVTLPDGTVLAGGHYGTDAGTVQVKDMVTSAVSNANNPLAERDSTNTIVARNIGGTIYAIQARCIDAAGRETEVEFGVRFAF